MTNLFKYIKGYLVTDFVPACIVELDIIERTKELGAAKTLRSPFDQPELLEDCFPS